MKTYILEPMNKLFYTARTIAIVSTIGVFVVAGFALMGVEKIHRWYITTWKEGEMI